jgi:hypothetical protein
VFDVDKILMSDISDFLNVSSQTIVRKEDELFSDSMKRNKNGYRYCDMYALCEAFNCYWGEYPSWAKVASFLYDKGLTDSIKVTEVLLKLKAQEKVS